MAFGMQGGFRADPKVAPVSAAPPPKAASRDVASTNPAVESARIAQRARGLVEVHILCLAELRPRAGSRDGAHLRH